VLGILAVLGTIAGLILAPKSFLFPALVAYVAWGLVKTVFVGLMDRLPSGDPLDDDILEEDEVDRDIEIAELPVARRRRRRHGRRITDRSPYNPHLTEGGE
jgi:CDP-diacylglycerol--serine O-phosphatidyltransferase